MSVPVDRRSHNDLEVLVKARELAEYTIKITRNEKNFDPQYKSVMADAMTQKAIDIYTSCFAANKTRLDIDHMYIRKNEQERANRLCVELRALIEIAKGLYHLSAKRCVYWDKKVEVVQKLVTAWKESDAKRLSS